MRLRDRTDRIANWFVEHDGDGEFVCGSGDVPYAVVGPTRTTECIVYTTKPTVVVSLLVGQQDHPRPIAVVGRYGLPLDDDVSWIRALAARRPVYFMGDMDPVDLLVFAWLRVRLRPQVLKHLGINQNFLSALKLRPSKSVFIRCTPDEVQAMSLVDQVLPDIDAIIGAKCKRWLRQGHKLELDFFGTRGGKAARESRRMIVLERLRSEDKNQKSE